MRRTFRIHARDKNGVFIIVTAEHFDYIPTVDTCILNARAGVEKGYYTLGFLVTFEIYDNDNAIAETYSDVDLATGTVATPTMHITLDILTAHGIMAALKSEHAFHRSRMRTIIADSVRTNWDSTRNLDDARLEYVRMKECCDCHNALAGAIRQPQLALSYDIFPADL